MGSLYSLWLTHASQLHFSCISCGIFLLTSSSHPLQSRHKDMLQLDFVFKRAPGSSSALNPTRACAEHVVIWAIRSRQRNTEWWSIWLPLSQHLRTSSVLQGSHGQVLKIQDVENITITGGNNGSGSSHNRNVPYTLKNELFDVFFVLDGILYGISEKCKIPQTEPFCLS